MTTTLSFDDATQSGGALTWTVASPALERRRPAHAPHPVRQRDHHAADGHANGGAHRYTDRHTDPSRDAYAYTDTHGDAYAHADAHAHAHADDDYVYDDRADHRHAHTPCRRVVHLRST